MELEGNLLLLGAEVPVLMGGLVCIPYVLS